MSIESILPALQLQAFEARQFIEEDIGAKFGLLRSAMAKMLRELLDALEQEGNNPRRRPDDDRRGM